MRHTSSSLICFPKLVAWAAGNPGWARLIATIRFGMSRLFLGCSSRMRTQPWSMRTRSRHAIEEYRHMPSWYPDPDWQTFRAQPHSAGANNSVSVSHQHMSKYHHTYSIWKSLPHNSVSYTLFDCTAGPSYNIHVMNTRWMSILILIPSGLVYKIRCACNRIISGDQARKLRFPCLGRCVAATALFE